MSEPSGSTVLADARFHDDLLGLEAYYLIERNYWKMGFVDRLHKIHSLADGHDQNSGLDSLVVGAALDQGDAQVVVEKGHGRKAIGKDVHGGDPRG